MAVDPLLLGSLGFLATMLCLIIAWIVKANRDSSATANRTRALLEAVDQDNQQRRQNRPVLIGGQRRGGPRRRPVGGARATRPRDEDDDDDDGDFGAANDFSDEDMDPEELTAEDLGVDGNVGKKKLAKLQAKAEKRAQREAEMVDREEKKKREKQKEEKERKDQEKVKLEEEERKEKERLEREEKERREHEEYLKMKEAFEVEEVGFDQIDEEESDNLMRDFVDYVKTTKVVNMDELGAHFKMRTQDAIDRIKFFVDNGTLTGVIDDRGKFIYITMDELNAVAKFINQRGRVSVAELADYSNQLIKLESGAVVA
uniref:DDRGK domain-containing protein 1 n=1 Tax=Plectus sambesii TaxID=2011161 RepID=A0A914VS45_9BILA